MQFLSLVYLSGISDLLIKQQKMSHRIDMFFL